MKTNNYLKIVLTVIAINLTLLTAKELNLIPVANAANVPVKPAKGGTNYGFIPVNDDGTISVKVSNSDAINVKLTAISSSYTWDPINVKQK